MASDGCRQETRVSCKFDTQSKRERALVVVRSGCLVDELKVAAVTGWRERRAAEVALELRARMQ